MRKVRDALSPFQFRRNLEVSECDDWVRWHIVVRIFTRVTPVLSAPLSLQLRLNSDRLYRGTVTGERILGGDT